nr:keratin, type I cytoskeletal 18-like [Physcomitrium patens]|eukprot:XP_024392359.1 keratin, type I cytoskeletal 18-like [Physcomitrella patens]
MAEQRQKLLEQDRVNRATKEANSRLKHALGVKQQAWEKEREHLHQGMVHQKQELSNSLNQSKLEVEKMKQQLELNQTKMATLEQEKKTMSDQFRVKTEEMQGEINTLKEVAKKLEKELVSVRRPQGSIEGSIGELEQKVKQEQYQLEAKDTRILQLESQVRELGALNEDLMAKLNIVPINVSDGEDEEVTLEL